MPRSLRRLLGRERQDSPSGKSPLGRQVSPAPQVPKKSYWDLAALELHRDEPTIYEAFRQMLRDQDPNLGDIQAQLSSTVQKNKQTMDERQWTLPFRVRGRTEKIRGQLDGILKVLQATKDIGSALAGIDPIHAGIPWAAVNLILAGALNDSEQYKAALDGLSEIVPLVARYKKIELTYLQSESTGLRKVFENCLITLYASVLKYQVSAGCHCQRNTFVRFLRAVPKLDAWASMLQDIKSNDNKCKDFTIIFDSQNRRVAQCNLQNLLKSQEEKMVEWSRKIDELVDDRKRQENSRILRWICDVIPGRDHQYILVTSKMGSEYKESGRWLYNSPDFVSWMSINGLNEPPFWLSGSVGMGKNSLICRAIEWCIENSSDNGGQVAYFYCSGKGGQSQSRGTDPAIIFRSLVRQFAWTREGEIAPPVTNIYRRMSGERPQGSDFSMEESSDVLIQTISALPDTTIIIDALDECAHPYKFLRALKRLRNDTTGNIRILVSGRNHIDVSSVIEECQITSFGLDSNVDDIHSFILKEVKHGDRQLLRGNEPALEDRLVETLRSRAQGNFRWVELQLAIFMDENSPLRLPESVSDRMNDLDTQVGIPDLTAVYDEIYWMNVKASDRDRINAEKCYQMVLACIRPLRCSQIAKAIALNDDGTFNPNIDKLYLQAICSNLLVIDNEGCFEFAHLSVIEYLGKGSFGGIYSFESYHSSLATICLTFFTGKEGNLPHGVAFMNYPKSFEEYADVCWPIHCENISADSRRKGKLGWLLNEFLSLTSIRPSFVGWLDTLRGLPQTRSFSSVWKKGAWNILSEQNTSLFAICAWGFVEFIDDAQSLFEKESIRLDALNDCGQTPLMVAVQFSRLPVVESLLGCKVDLEAKARTGQDTAVMISAEYSEIEIFNLLLEKGADIEIKDKWQNSLLHRVCSCNHEKSSPNQERMARLLLEKGADVEATNCWKETPLLMTIGFSALSTVQLLLDFGASTAAVDINGMTPLILSARTDDEDVTLLILQHTADRDLVRRGVQQWSVLTETLYHGANRSDILKLLVSEIDLESIERLRSDESIEFAVLLRLLKNTSPLLFDDPPPPFPDRYRLPEQSTVAVEKSSDDSSDDWSDDSMVHSLDDPLFIMDGIYYYRACLTPTLWLRQLRGQSNTDEDLTCEPLPKRKYLSRVKSMEW